jgi:hypothetical protein
MTTTTTTPLLLLLLLLLLITLTIIIIIYLQFIYNCRPVYTLLSATPTTTDCRAVYTLSPSLSPRPYVSVYFSCVLKLKLKLKDFNSVPLIYRAPKQNPPAPQQHFNCQSRVQGEDYGEGRRQDDSLEHRCKHQMRGKIL